MLDRNVLIVDDDDMEVNIDIFNDILVDLKKEVEIQYDINYEWVSSIELAVDKIRDSAKVYDVLIIDHNFTKGTKYKQGSELIKIVRENYNKRCKIIFYTMHAISEISSDHILTLLNMDVFRFIQKDGGSSELVYPNQGFNKSDQVIVEAVLEALNDLDPYSTALEKYIIKHRELLGKAKLKLNEKEFTIEEIVDSIRLDKEPGKTFIQNLIEMSILDHLEI